VCEKSADGLRSLAVIEVQRAAESLTTRDPARSNLGCCWRDELVAETLVRPFFMIVVDKLIVLRETSWPSASSPPRMRV